MIFPIAGIMTAHPRRCGENSRGVRFPSRARGSSPQVRGKRGAPDRRRPRSRLIPAGAGKTNKVTTGTFALAAHPRRCGENGFSLSDSEKEAGSSPQVRGKLTADGTPQVEVRLIPAGAGKTLADMELYPHIASFRISLEPKASINPT